MNLNVQTDCNGIAFEDIKALLKEVGMGTHTNEKHQKAFEASYRVVFVLDYKKVIGCGRLLSDGVYQGALYDIAVNPDYQGLGIGQMILDTLLEDLEDMTMMLYAAKGKESFYQKFNFSKAKTAMLRFVDAEAKKKAGMIE